MDIKRLAKAARLPKYMHDTVGGRDALAEFAKLVASVEREAWMKANNEAEALRQRLMRAEHHANAMQSFAEVAARRSEVLFAALKRIADGPWPDECEGPGAQCRFDEAVAREAIAKVGAHKTPNVKVRGPEAALSPEAPSRLPGSAA